MERIFIMGDSYSYGFLEYFNMIELKYIKTHIFYGERDVNINQHMDYINKLNVNDEYPDIKKRNIENMIYRIDSYDPTIMIYNLGQIDINFLYFYNKLYNIPYDVDKIIDNYMSIIQYYSKKCKKIYIVNILPLFVRNAEQLVAEFVRICDKHLLGKMSESKINKIFDIKKYRQHLYTCNESLRQKINDIKWNVEVVYVDVNKFIYKHKNKSFRNKFYMQRENTNDILSSTLNFHINANVYLETLLKNNIIPELTENINKCVIE